MPLTYNNHLLPLVSIVIIVLAILVPRRLLGIPSRAIRVTARNIVLLISTVNLNSFNRFNLRNHRAIVCALSRFVSITAKSR
jgi:hypothetical protein